MDHGAAAATFDKMPTTFGNVTARKGKLEHDTIHLGVAAGLNSFALFSLSLSVASE
jgi:hypothetical protein